MKVQQVMTHPVVTVRPDTSCEEVIQTMLTVGVSGLPVVDDAGRLAGIVTEADLVTKEAFGHRHRVLDLVALIFRRDNRWVLKATAMTAGAMMTTPVVTVAPDDDLRVAAGHLVTLGIARVVVVDQDQHPIGIVSRRDIVRVMHENAGTDAAAVVGMARD